MGRPRGEVKASAASAVGLRLVWYTRRMENPMRWQDQDKGRETHSQLICVLVETGSPWNESEVIPENLVGEHTIGLANAVAARVVN